MLNICICQKLKAPERTHAEETTTLNRAHGLQIVGANYESWPRIKNRGNGLLIVGMNYKSWKRTINRGN